MIPYLFSAGLCMTCLLLYELFCIIWVFWMEMNKSGTLEYIRNKTWNQSSYSYLEFDWWSVPDCETDVITSAWCALYTNFSDLSQKKQRCVLQYLMWTMLQYSDVDHCTVASPHCDAMMDTDFLEDTLTVTSSARVEGGMKQPFHHAPVRS